MGRSHVQQVLDSIEAQGSHRLKGRGGGRSFVDPGGLPKGSASIIRPCGRWHSNSGRGGSMQHGRGTARDLAWLEIRVRHP